MKNTRKLPLSKKFYADLCERIRSAVNSVSFGMRVISYYLVLQTINNYIIYGTPPDASVMAEVHLIFQILKPEIDKAIERSRRARESAARRREAKEALKAAPETNPETTVAPEPVSETSTPPEISDPVVTPAVNQPESRVEVIFRRLSCRKFKKRRHNKKIPLRLLRL